MGTITVGFDGSPNAMEAVRWAATEAAARRVTLEVVHAWHWPYLDASFDHAPVDPTAFVAAGRELLDRGVELARRDAPDVDIEPVLTTGPARTALLEAAVAAELLVVGVRGTGGVMGLLLGSVSDYVVRHASVPVVVVPPNPPGGVEVLVGVDGSAASERAARVAVEFAARRGVGLRVLMAWSYLTPIGSRGPEPFTPDYREAEALEALKGVVGDLAADHPSVRVEPELVCDLPARALLAAGEHAGLVVVGARGLGGFRGLMLGSVSAQLVHHCTAPVMVVHAGSGGDHAG